MRIEIVNGEIVLSDVFNGIGIRTDMGLFGIAQRDGGIEVMLDGKTVWDAHELPRSPPVGIRFHETAAASLWRTREAIVDRIGRFDITSVNPAARKRLSYLTQAIEAIDTARRLLHETFPLDDATSRSPYYKIG